jgi:nucleotide-binding universal stress UspA family protein
VLQDAEVRRKAVGAMEQPLVVGVGGSAPSLLAVDWAVDEAARPGVPLPLVHAFVPDESDHGATDRTGDADPLSERVSAEDVVATAAARARRRDPDAKSDSEAVPGDALSVLLAEGRHASALVTGSRGPGELTGLLLGSIGPAPAARAHCPVIVVRGDTAGLAGRHERILLGAGDPGTSTETVRFAFREAEGRGCTLDIVRAGRRPARESADHPRPSPEAARRHGARASALLDTLLRDVVLDHHHQVLHLDSGPLERRTRYGLGEGRSTAVRQQWLVPMADPHLAALRAEFRV